MPQFADLLREHQSLVYSLAYHALGDRAAAEDLTQEVFLALHEHLGKLESEAHVKAWLMRVTANRSIDEIRRRRYRRGPSLEQTSEPVREPLQEEMVLRDEVRRLVATLPATARTILILRYQEELELAEIARLLEVPVQTVKSRLHRSVNLLRQRIARKFSAARAGRQA